MVVAEPVHRLSESEYLKKERRTETKCEFFEGEVFAMGGGSLEHSLIATNLVRLVGNQLEGKPCVPFNSDLRIKVEATGLLTYPDLSIVCGPPKFADDERDTILNPTVLVEVLSDSTEAYDRGKKFENYRRMASLQEYLLVSQKEPRIEQFIRQPNGEWLLREAVGKEVRLELPSLNITMLLAEVYARVEFTRTPLRTQKPSPN